MQNGTNIGKFVDYKLVKSTERKGRDGGLEIYRNTQKIYRNDMLGWLEGWDFCQWLGSAEL